MEITFVFSNLSFNLNFQLIASENLFKYFSCNAENLPVINCVYFLVICKKINFMIEKKT